MDAIGLGVLAAEEYEKSPEDRWREFTDFRMSLPKGVAVGIGALMVGGWVPRSLWLPGVVAGGLATNMAWNSVVDDLDAAAGAIEGIPDKVVTTVGTMSNNSPLNPFNTVGLSNQQVYDLARDGFNGVPQVGTRQIRPPM